MTHIVQKIKAKRKSRILSKSVNESSHGENNISNTNDISKSALPLDWYFSFEFFPPKTEYGLDNLLVRIEKMSNLNPIFIDITWGHSGSTSAKSMELASFAQRYCGVDVLLHLTCTGMTKEQIAFILQQAKSSGIHNILALRGDSPRGKWEKNETSGSELERAIDLVKLIKDLHGDYFGIAVAGHPEGHPSSEDKNWEMQHLQEKIMAGADFIMTQFFYDVKVFLDYVKTCRKSGITCPIIPGILPIQSYSNFVRMTKFCGVSVPTELLEQLESVQNDMEAMKRIGNDFVIAMCRTILNTAEDEGGVDGIHFHTLNLERSVVNILMTLSSTTRDRANSISDASFMISSIGQRQFPWRPSAMERREKEDVRPIHWANRPKSYVMRTDDWDEYPNGRWGDSSSPAFGELSNLSHFYSFTLGSDEDRLDMLGNNPKCPEDVYEVFAKYVEGEIRHLPWCETPLQLESKTIESELAALNRAGYLTINSQPSVNGVNSNHKIFGWGGSNGHIYQKGYVECFVSPENTEKLVSMVRSHDSMNLYAVNHFGKEIKVNVEEGGVTALTWGVFPCREIQQPTIFHPSTFLVWAEEAFSLWTSMWLNLYDMQSESFDLIETIRDTYYLVAIIDNDFISDANGGKLWNELLNLGSG